MNFFGDFFLNHRIILTFLNFTFPPKERGVWANWFICKCQNRSNYVSNRRIGFGIFILSIFVQDYSGIEESCWKIYKRWTRGAVSIYLGERRTFPRMFHEQLTYILFYFISSPEFFEDWLLKTPSKLRLKWWRHKIVSKKIKFESNRKIKYNLKTLLKKLNFFWMLRNFEDLTELILSLDWLAAAYAFSIRN